LSLLFEKRSHSTEPHSFFVSLILSKALPLYSGFSFLPPIRKRLSQ
jgi:hypothetical protein